MKSALITIFISILLVSCTKDNTVVPEEETPKKVYEEIQVASGLYSNIRVLGQSSDSYLKPGDFPPDFLINEKNENEFSLSDLRGKVVFLEFWRTGCHFCIESIPSLVSAYNTIDNDDFIVITITTDRSLNVSQTKVKEFLTKFSMDEWINIYDGNTLTSSIANHYNLVGTPTSYLIGKDGKIVSRPHPDNSDFIKTINNELAK
ncbi:MAG: TlpA disulfide reductase family protein [Candidatus Kapaibacterium sp.]